MPPHLGGLEVVAEALFAAYQQVGWEARWIASHEPPETLKRDKGKFRVSCWNEIERRFGVPWPIWGSEGFREVTELAAWADIVQVHDCLYFSSALAVGAARLAKKPVLLSQHIGFVPYQSRVLRSIEALAYHSWGYALLLSSTHVVYCTPSAEAYISSLIGKRESATSLIPYGIDTRRFTTVSDEERLRLRIDFGLQATEPVVLFAGRLVEKKGVNLVYQVGRQCPKIQFLIVGDGPIHPPQLENLTWIQYMSPEAMQKAYQAADVFLLPSHGEGFPLSVLEAMACGLPVIISKGEAFTEKLKHLNSCRIIDRTAQAITEALAGFLGNLESARALGRIAREQVVRDWSLDAMADRYFALIRELVRTER